MNHLSKYSQHDSSEEEDEVNINYFQQVSSLKMCRSTGNLVSKPALRVRSDIDEPEDQQLLKPKLPIEKQPAVIPNVSSISQKSAALSRRPLTAAYTFKLKTPTTTRKKNDPVSLFQQTSQTWKKDKFLTNRANNKQGRKLELDKRNKQMNKF